MKKSYDGALVMPRCYVEMDEGEMVYLRGGMKLPMLRMFLNKPSCETVANELIKAGKWKNITITQLKKEIYAHAYVYYNWSSLKNSKLQGLRGIYNSAANGIDVCDGVDPRQAIFNTIWLL